MAVIVATAQRPRARVSGARDHAAWTPRLPLRFRRPALPTGPALRFDDGDSEERGSLMTMRQSPARGGPGWQATEWICGIIGGIATFLGFFILFGPEDEFVGIGGDLSWQVGEISSAWTYSLVIGGLVLLVVALTMVILGRGRTVEPIGRALSLRSDLYWHAGIFVLVNAFIWLQDLAIGGGVDYAFWVTIPWAVGLAIHGLAYVYGRGREVPVAPVEEKEKERELTHH